MKSHRAIEINRLDSEFMMKQSKYGAMNKRSRKGSHSVAV